MKVLASLLLMSMPHTEALTKPSSMLIYSVGMIAIVCLAVGYYFSKQRNVWVNSSAIVQGTIVDVYRKYLRHDKSGNQPLYFPTVVFNVDGNRFQTVANYGTQHLYREGDKIDVRYNPKNPSQAKIGNENAPGINPSVMYGIGGVLGLLVLVMSL